MNLVLKTPLSDFLWGVVILPPASAAISSYTAYVWGCSCFENTAFIFDWACLQNRASFMRAQWTCTTLKPSEVPCAYRKITPQIYYKTLTGIRTHLSSFPRLPSCNNTRRNIFQKASIKSSDLICTFERNSSDSTNQNLPRLESSQ